MVLSRGIEPRLPPYQRGRLPLADESVFGTPGETRTPSIVADPKSAASTNSATRAKCGAGSRNRTEPMAVWKTAGPPMSHTRKSGARPRTRTGEMSAYKAGAVAAEPAGQCGRRAGSRTLLLLVLNERPWPPGDAPKKWSHHAGSNGGTRITRPVLCPLRYGGETGGRGRTRTGHPACYEQAAQPLSYASGNSLAWRISLTASFSAYSSLTSIAAQQPQLNFRTFLPRRLTLPTGRPPPCMIAPESGAQGRPRTDKRPGLSRPGLPTSRHPREIWRQGPDSN